MDKKIKKSHRGLTFSFLPTEKLDIGSRFDYIIDPATANIRIVPAQEGRHTVSRKKAGQRWRPLVDLRSREVLDAISAMSEIKVSITGEEIIVSDAKTTVGAKVFYFPRVELAQMRKASGQSDTFAAGQLLSQITLDEYLASQENQALDISAIHKALPDLYTLVSLFSGAGIFDWPFSTDGRFKIQYAIDYDDAAVETYRHNIGTHIVHGDIHRAFTGNGYPLDDMVDKPDVIIGGPSCKPFSNANRHTRLADHPDSDLIVQYMRIVGKLRPKVFALENVPAVLTACDGAYFEEIKKVAAEQGYSISAKIVQDNLVGGFTTRRRAIVLGSRIGPAAFNDVSLASGSRTAGDALRAVNKAWSNFDDVTLPNPETKRRMSFVPQGGNYESIPEEFRTPSKNRHSCTYRRLDWGAPSPTIVNWRKPPLIHPTEDRTLTVAEAKALQGLPGHFRIFGSLGQMQQQVGNSVPVAIGTFVKNMVLKLLGAQNVALTVT